MERFVINRSDTLHDINMIHEIQRLVIGNLKAELPHISQFEYFSDGCAAQYKNKYNFKILCMHQINFELGASWVFFATSHGKSPCDGVGGTVKRAVTKESL